MKLFYPYQPVDAGVALLAERRFTGYPETASPECRKRLRLLIRGRFHFLYVRKRSFGLQGYGSKARPPVRTDSPAGPPFISTAWLG
jgi:hypothetical protein